MTTPVVEPVVVPAAVAAQGAGADALNPSEIAVGNPAPTPAPAVKPATAEEVAAAKVTADAEAAKVAETAAAAALEAEKTTPLDITVWGSTGSELGDSVLTVLQNAGMSTDDAKALFGDAMKAGDVSKVDVAALEAKIGKARASLVLAGASAYVKEAADKSTAIVTEVHKTVGGKDAWDAVTAWANASVPEADRNEYGVMIDAGGAQARFAAAELLGRFNADAKNTTINAATAVVIPGATPTTTGRATSRNEYAAEMTAAHNKGKSEADIAEIKAARVRGRALNL